VLFAFIVLGLVSSALSQEIGQEERVRNDLFCVKWDIKPYVNQPDMTEIGFGLQHAMLWWRGGATGKASGLAISRSQVQILIEAMLRNDLRQVVYTYVPLSPSSITWYRPKGGDAQQLGR